MLAAAIQASLHDQQTPEQPTQQPQPEPQQVRFPQNDPLLRLNLRLWLRLRLRLRLRLAPAPAPTPTLALLANRVHVGACRRRLCRARTAARPPSPSCGSDGSSASRVTPRSRYE